MSIIDSKGRVFGKISIVDVIIVLLIVAVACAGVYKFVVAKKFVTNVEDVIIKVYTDEVPSYVIDMIKPGDIVKDANKNIVLGTYIDKVVTESKSFAANDEGKFVASGKEGFKSLLVSVEGKAVLGNEGITIGNTETFIGKSTEIHVGNVTFWGRIYSIEKKE